MSDSERNHVQVVHVDNYEAVMLSDYRCIEACIEKKVGFEEQHTDVWSGWYSGAYCSGDEAKAFPRTYLLPNGYDAYLIYDVKTEDTEGRSWISRIAPDRKSVEIVTSCRSGLLDSQTNKYRIHFYLYKPITDARRREITNDCRRECGL